MKAKMSLNTLAGNNNCNNNNSLITLHYVRLFWNRLIANYITFAVGEVLLLILTICSLAAIFPRVSYNTFLDFM